MYREFEKGLTFDLVDKEDIQNILWNVSHNCYIPLDFPQLPLGISAINQPAVKWKMFISKLVLVKFLMLNNCLMGHKSKSERQILKAHQWPRWTWGKLWVSCKYCFGEIQIVKIMNIWLKRCLKVFVFWEAISPFKKSHSFQCLEFSANLGDTSKGNGKHFQNIKVIEDVTLSCWQITDQNTVHS